MADSAEKAFQDKLDAEGNAARDTKLVFADWLADRDDPRAEGYRIMAAQGIYPFAYPTMDGPKARTWRTDSGLPNQVMPHMLPRAWFDALKGGERTSSLDYKTYESRREAEDAAAAAFATLSEEDKLIALAMPHRYV